MSPSAALAYLVLTTTSQSRLVEELRVNGVDVDVFTPSLAPGEKIVGDVLVLPGWDSNRKDWCAKDHGLCDEAQRRHMRLVMPEMGKSVYAAALYPETSAAFKKDPTRAALIAVIATLQKERALLADPARTFVIGRSTGGRGAVLLALDEPAWFRAVASLSGDFDQTKTPNDGLMRGAYGPIDRFPDRWRGADNPTWRVTHDVAGFSRGLSVPLYLGHGKRDAVVPVDESRAFADVVRQARQSRAEGASLSPVLTLHIDDNGAHNHSYWRTELAPVFDFFVAAMGASAP